MNNAPLCDLDPSHGTMQAELIYLLSGEVDTRYGSYWFCQVEGCEGYGGKAFSNKRSAVSQKLNANSYQLEMEL